MKHLQVLEIGRCAKELNNYPILAGRDPHAVLAAEIEFYWERGAVITPVASECDSYAIMRRKSLIGGKQVIKVRLVDVGIADDDTQEVSTEDLSR